MPRYDEPIGDVAGPHTYQLLKMQTQYAIPPVLLWTGVVGLE